MLGTTVQNEREGKRERGGPRELEQLTDFGVPTNSVTNPSLETLLYFNQSRKGKKEVRQIRWGNLKLYALVRMCYVGHSARKGALGHTMPHTQSLAIKGRKQPERIAQ